MESDIEQLTRLLESAAEDIENCDISVGGLDPEYQHLGDMISSVLLQMKTVYLFTASIADGNLSAPIPERHNHFAGPIKDLYYKLKHLTWQAGEVAKGDYSQRVDFLGEFSDSFNYMITELEKREQHVRQEADDQVHQALIRSEKYKREIERQMIYYHTYRDYVQSFLNFRVHYKKMMGEVYELFREKRYDEGRLLIARINDRMASEVVVNKQYSNNEFFDATISEISSQCHQKNIAFNGSIYIPEDYLAKINNCIEYLFDYIELVHYMLEIKIHGERKISIGSKIRNGWLSISVNYYVMSGKLPAEIKDCFCEDGILLMNNMSHIADNTDSFFNYIYAPEERKIKICFHISAPSL
ncbi:MAG: hypothetical protein LKJ76_06745 [Lachnospiraceae bacterium]|jgi:hypothetical protein|nr:hypothetical protein [Lachnospiraceae bacterium]